jgi:hypothetical protein
MAADARKNGERPGVAPWGRATPGLAVWLVGECISPIGSGQVRSGQTAAVTSLPAEKGE